MAAKVEFQPTAKIIQVTQAPSLLDGEMVVELDVKIDIYSDGKEDWVIDSSLNKFRFPLESVGGNPLPGSKELGATFFLADGWKIRPYESDHVMRVNGNLYREDGVSPYTSTVGSYNVLLESTVSSLVDSTVQQLADIEYASFQSGVWLDSVNGDDTEKGNEQFPVQTVEAALAVAVERGFKKIYLLSDTTFTTGHDLDDFSIIGQSHVHSNLNIETGADCHRVHIKCCIVDGVIDGDTEIDDCVIHDITYFNGHIHECGLKGTITLAGDKKALISDCRTVDEDSPPTIDMGGSGQSLAMPNYSGIVTITNLSDADQEIGIGLDAGMVVLDNTITAGHVMVAGIGLITDNSGGTTDVNIDGLINNTSISSSVWDGLKINHTISGSFGNELATKDDLTGGISVTAETDPVVKLAAILSL